MDAALLTEAGYAIGLGLIVGLEREHSEVASGLADGAIPEQTGRAPLQPAAGVRTLGLFGLVGWLLAYLGGSWPWLLPVGLLAVAAMVSVQIAVSRDTGITTEVAALVVLLLGAVVRFDRGLAVALALATTALLVSKGWVRGFVVKLRRVELTATLQLLILVAIVLPLLPVEARDPWGGAAAAQGRHLRGADRRGAVRRLRPHPLAGCGPRRRPGRAGRWPHQLDRRHGVHGQGGEG